VRRILALLVGVAALVGIVALWGPTACSRRNAPPGGPRTIDLGGGDRVSFREAVPGTAVAQGTGPSSAPSTPSTDAAAGAPATVPVVFLHGASYDSSVWERLGLLGDVAALGHRAVAVDLPGKGNSMGDAGAAWLAKVLDRLGIDRAIVVAPSAGGAVGLDLLAAHPDRVAGFVPVSPVGGGDFTWKGGDAPPTVVVSGANDRGFAAGNAALAAAIPGARLVVIPDAGHAAYEDQPKAFLDAMRPLL